MQNWDALPGRLIVVSGPSGCGKSTLVRRVVARPDLRARLSVSATTRPARVGEVPGKDYFFLSRAEFESARNRREFLEWAEVHGNLYGTPAWPVREALGRGDCVILEIDVQGALLVRERVPNALLVFVDVPSFAVLEERLRGRATDDEAIIQRRLANARTEMAQIGRYDYVLINDVLDRAEAELADLIARQGCRGTTPGSPEVGP